MKLTRLQLKNFRLHNDTICEFSEHLNFIAGGNGQGKTTILEAIYYLCTTKSMGGASDYEAVTFERENFDIKGLFTELTENEVRVFYDNSIKKKHLFIDNKQFHRASRIIGMFPVVTLTQSDHAITLGSPSDRRKFIDSVISQASKTYLKDLIDFNKILRQRSLLLNQIKETNNKQLFSQLDAWTENLINRGTEIVKHRFEFFSRFNDYLNTAYNKIMQGSEKPEIVYTFLESTEPNKIEELYRNRLDELRDAELRRTTNLVGPHRDDFHFLINGFELKKYGSQGQHKTFQIALRFGEFFYLKDALSKTPMFLLDDVFGELDTFRAMQISSYLGEVGQAFITMTDFTKYDFLNRSELDRIFKVEQGIVKTNV